jgi:biotin-(acetyl-CoA carboxylase) ligase
MITGVLIEISCEPRGGTNFAVGIGINVNMPDKFKYEIDRPWVDLRRITGKNDSKLCCYLFDKLD